MEHDGIDRSVLVQNHDVHRLEGRDAQTDNFAAAKALSDVIASTLGPKGLDKLLVTSDGTVVVTNDGASIVDRMEIVHPAARSVVDVASKQDSRVGDGTTSTIVLTGALLTEAESLLESGLHQTSVARGYSLAAERATETLRQRTVPIDSDDEEQLRSIAETAITGKWNQQASEFLAEKTVSAVRAIQRDRTVELRRLTRKAIPGGSYYDSEVVDGLVIDMESSSTTAVSPEPGPLDAFNSATVALVDDQLTIETVSGQGAVSLESPDDLQTLRTYERDIYERYVDRIVDTGADVVFCQKSIDDMVRYLLAREGVLAVERTRQDELEKLGRATGAHAVGTVDDLTESDVGRAQRIDQRDLGPTEVIVVDGGPGVEQASLVLRGGTQQVADEAKRVVDGCFHVLSHAIEDSIVVPGGGATEVSLASDLRSYAASVSGREQLAIEAFADALEAIPRQLASSGGMDPIDTIVELRASHDDGEFATGLVFEGESGTIDDVRERGVLEPFAVKARTISGAAEAANLLVRVDDVVATSGKETGEEAEHDHDHGPGACRKRRGVPLGGRALDGALRPVP
ncbi:thermosome subunit alpha [Natrinema sp. SYSU A 869]|uniref:thermosome subunit alpha n=1 Tax=Natrinema sp. SYSU A 869 TaxID=2871694 RepID=UPI002105967B|nr:thermosome subunit alpha [Natrinema sp. SYSU A 869]